MLRPLINHPDFKKQIIQMVRMLQDIRLTVGHDHEHIAPVWQASVSSAESTLPAIVTPHYRNGNVLEYARGKPDSDFLEMVYQAASALSYIHAKGDIHGNFCPVSFVSSDYPLISSLRSVLMWYDRGGKYMHCRRWQGAHYRCRGGCSRSSDGQPVFEFCTEELDV